MTQIISIGKLSWYLIFPFILSICCFFQSAISSILRDLLKDTNNPDNPNSTFIIVANSIHLSSLLLSGFLAAISKRLTNNKNEKQISQMTFKTILHCLLCTLIYIGSLVISVHNNLNDFKATHPFTILEKMMQLLFCIILCFFIFKYRLHRHHYFSIGICFIFSIFIVIIKNNNNNDLDNSEKNNPIEILWYLFFYCVYASREVYEKWIMEKKYISPYLMLFIEGFILLIIGGIAALLIYFINKDFFNVFTFPNKLAHFLMIIVLLVVQILLDITRIMTINHFTSIHRYVADVLLFFYETIGTLILGNFYNIWSIVFLFFCDLFIIFGILLYLEVAILHVFNMNRETQITIDKRAEKDSSKLEDLLMDNIDSINGSIDSINGSIDEM